MQSIKNVLDEVKKDHPDLYLSFSDNGDGEWMVVVSKNDFNSYTSVFVRDALGLYQKVLDAAAKLKPTCRANTDDIWGQPVPTDGVTTYTTAYAPQQLAPMPVNPDPQRAEIVWDENLQGWYLRERE